MILEIKNNKIKLIKKYKFEQNYRKMLHFGIHFGIKKSN